RDARAAGARGVGVEVEGVLERAGVGVAHALVPPLRDGARSGAAEREALALAEREVGEGEAGRAGGEVLALAEVGRERAPGVPPALLEADGGLRRLRDAVVEVLGDGA